MKIPSDEGRVNPGGLEMLLPHKKIPFKAGNFGFKNFI